MIKANLLAVKPVNQMVTSQRQVSVGVSPSKSKQDEYQPGAASQFYYRGISQGYQVNWSSDDLSAGRAQDMSQTEPSYSAKESLEAVCKKPGGDDWACTGERRSLVKLAAQVGKYLSVDQLDTGYVPGAAHDWSTRYLQTINLDTGKPVALTDLFPEKAIFSALMNDPVIKQALASERVKERLNGKSPASLTELKQAVAGWVSPDGRFSLDGLGDHFTFHHLKGEQVAVRLSLPYGVEAYRGTMSQLGLYLPIPAGLETELKRAAATEDGTGRKAGMLWSEAEQKFGNRETYFELPPAR